MNETEPLTAYLATHDAPCPGCNANLRGQDEPVCPRCFKDLWLGELRSWHEVCGDAKGEPCAPSNGRIYQRVFDKLENLDFACPECGYQLRGIRSECCPECAKRIRPTEVLSKNATAVERDIGTFVGVLMAIAFLLMLVLTQIN